ncbi:CTP:molybdopterin cytidylyltransferase MocA [Rhizomicrobium palustre]|uniref:CTP:molybdopterin cytidylyltransferase MocA n=1 Tax=Rhizomicrobium palustre TaxID=189966 RepID=A0A846N4A5_9PROT|nr:nucleotidyltransferase family protein [Rhizomicrobium palustre]NIK89927.1 CTP:molybdopterin cytidylyltransferase MocA [Rhizomicrobium palustre]
MPKIAAIVLAAGLSRRFGANKLLQEFRGKPLIRHVVESAQASTAGTVVVVTGAESHAVKAVLADTKVELVDNIDFSTGLSSSLIQGLKSVPPDCAGALILLGDMPLVSAEIIDQLIEMFSPTSSRAIGVPLSQGRQGNPVLWGRQFFPELLALSGDRGAKALITAHQDWVYTLEVGDPAVHIDIDTPDDLHRYE